MSESNPLRDEIQNAITENRVMLFMKGTPEQPACGFSMRTSAAHSARTSSASSPHGSTTARRWARR